MAISISIPSTYGVNATYWNISFIQNNFKDKVLYVKLLGYADSISRENEAMPLSVVELTFRDELYPGDISRQELYNLIIKMDEFKGSLSV